jgi:hypothetical protein
MIEIEPYIDGEGVPDKKWTERNYPFANMLPGDKLFVTESIAYFRSEASRWFRKNRPKAYQTRTVTRDGIKGVLLTRIR